MAQGAKFAPGANAIQRASLKEDAGQTITNFMKGFEIEPAKLTDLAINLRRLGDDKTANTLDTIEGMSGDLANARRGPIGDFQTYVRGLEDEAASEGGEARAALDVHRAAVEQREPAAL